MLGPPLEIQGPGLPSGTSVAVTCSVFSYCRWSMCTVPSWDQPSSVWVVSICVPACLGLQTSLWSPLSDFCRPHCIQLYLGLLLVWSGLPGLASSDKHTQQLSPDTQILQFCSMASLLSQGKSHPRKGGRAVA